MLATQERTIGNFNVDEVTTAPLRVVKTARLNAPQAEVFAVVGDHAGMSAWFPQVQAVRVDNAQAQTEGGAGATRYCTITDGVVLTEHIVAFDPPDMYGYAISDDNPFGTKNHLAVISLEAEGEHDAILTWRQYFDHPDNTGIAQAISEALDGGIQGLIERFGGELLETSFPSV